ncbi:MAG: tRNA (pseudouridine(54)-N(1))-methyltransferase TrmY [Candidatus Aenigmatarchaeota archaeon]|nr:MAG: tRNA (pseudouridine(54)-N(1))-methyltransferase TrmY [Candidatus Aenigmarchaeota archaeon]
MRTFVLYSQGSTGTFNLNDLPSSGHRIDTVARCVNASLWLSYALRHDTRFYVVLNGPPDPPKTLLFEGGGLEGVTPDERNIGAWILKANAVPVRGKDWARAQKGLHVSKKSFHELMREFKGSLCLLSEKGKDIRTVELPANPVFVLGDSLDIPKGELKLLDKYKPLRVSLGKRSYLASHCITLVNNEMDRRG